MTTSKRSAQKLPEARVIGHIDMDAFFAAVEQRDDPKLRGKPVVVGADPAGGKGRGVVSTCSYEARVFGIRSAMPISEAYRRCPKAIFLPVDGKKYNRVSAQMFAILENFTPDIEPVSIDEAFMDLTGVWHLHGSPLALAQKIKGRIREELHLTASIGLAPVKMLAKIASDFSKPDGLLEIAPDKVFDFLWPLPVRRLWGVGPKAQERLGQLGVQTVGELARQPRETLVRHFGEPGAHMWELAHAIDPREVVTEHDTKSVGHEHTFDVDETKKDVLEATLLHLSEKVSRRLRQAGLKGRTIGLKIRWSDFTTFTRAHTLAERTNFADTIFREARSLAAEFIRQGRPIRLIGVRVTQFDDAYVQESLFDMNASKERLHQAVDQIKDKFGDKAIRRGS